MESTTSEVTKQVSGWTPELIVDLIEKAAWPVVVLILGWHFKGKIISVISSFFGNADVKEVSVGPSGITTKFDTTRQSEKIKGPIRDEVSELQDNADLKTMKEKQKANSTPYSEKLYDDFNAQLEKLKIDDNEKIEILTRDLSLSQVGLRFALINKVLFRSQYDLFSEMYSNNDGVSEQYIKLYFYNLIKNASDVWSGWDWSMYISYPVRVGLVEFKEEKYILTTVGTSYVSYMKRNVDFVNDLTKL